MPIKSLILVGLAALPALAAALPAAAQTRMRAPVHSRVPTYAVRHVRPRIEVAPRPLLYRRCTAWYVLQHRPSGTVLFPEQHCWWVRG